MTRSVPNTPCCGSMRGRCRSAASAPPERGVPMALLDVAAGGRSRDHREALVLSRPDGHIAWRQSRAGDPDGLIDTITGRSRAAAAGPRQQRAPLPRKQNDFRDWSQDENHRLPCPYGCAASDSGVQGRASLASRVRTAAARRRCPTRPCGKPDAGGNGAGRASGLPRSRRRRHANAVAAAVPADAFGGAEEVGSLVRRIRQRCHRAGVQAVS